MYSHRTIFRWNHHLVKSLLGGENMKITLIRRMQPFCNYCFDHTALWRYVNPRSATLFRPRLRAAYHATGNTRNFWIQLRKGMIGFGGAGHEETWNDSAVLQTRCASKLDAQAGHCISHRHRCVLLCLLVVRVNCSLHAGDWRDVF